MKAKLISVVAVIVLGIVVLMLTISNYTAVENSYNTSLARARAYAEKQIPYRSYNTYLEAFAIRCEDETVYVEFLEQAKELGTKYYNAAIEDYVVKFPMSSAAYELLCGMHYNNNNYQLVIDTALEAREKGIATEQVRDWYIECAHMVRVIKTGIEEPHYFIGGFALVKVKDNYGYIGENGDFLLAPVYPQASGMMDYSAAVNDGEEWHIINSSGFKVARTSEPVDYLGILIGEKIPVAKDGKYGYTNQSLVIPEKLSYDYASNFKGGVAAVKKGEKWALINTGEEQITDYIFEDVILDDYKTCCNGGVIFAKKDGKYYMVNAQGGKISDQGFDDARPFAGSEPAAICIDGKWGFVDASGKIVIEPTYESANSFNLGLGAVCIDGLWGYINSSGSIRIECSYEECLPFSNNGISAVKENGIWNYVRLLPYCD